MNLQKIKESLNCHVSNTIGTIQESEQYKKCIEYKFELALILFVGSGILTEGILYSTGSSPFVGLMWLIPIYGAYNNQLKVTRT